MRNPHPTPDGRVPLAEREPLGLMHTEPRVLADHSVIPHSVDDNYRGQSMGKRCREAKK